MLERKLEREKAERQRRLDEIKKKNPELKKCTFKPKTNKRRESRSFESLVDAQDYARKKSKKEHAIGSAQG